MHSRLATPEIGIVEGGQIVMHEARAMDKLKRGRGAVRQGGPVITAGHGHGQADRGPDARPARGNRVIQRRGQPTGHIAIGQAHPLRTRYGRTHGAIDTFAQVHGALIRLL